MAAMTTVCGAWHRTCPLLKDDFPKICNSSHRRIRHVDAPIVSRVQRRWRTGAIRNACQPPMMLPSAHGDGPTHWDLADRSQLKRLKNRLLGYPINMNDPPANSLAGGMNYFGRASMPSHLTTLAIRSKRALFPTTPTTMNARQSTRSASYLPFLSRTLGGSCPTAEPTAICTACIWAARSSADAPDDFPKPTLLARRITPCKFFVTC